MLEIRSKEVRFGYVPLFTIFVVLDFNISLRHIVQLFQFIHKNYNRPSAYVETVGT